MLNRKFYDNLDLKYGEIGIALTRIDRMNPGYVSFAIPSLNPNYGVDTVENKKIIQRNPSNIMNDKDNSVSIGDINVTNNLKIYIPKELCSLPYSIKYWNSEKGKYEYTSERYIHKNSKWLIMFIGGDIACPCIVCRLPDSAGNPITSD